MKCPECEGLAGVLETRHRDDGITRRRYACEKGHRFSTIEIIAARGVVKTGRPLVAPVRLPSWPPLSNATGTAANQGSPDSRVERGLTMQVQKPEFHVERTTP